MGNLVDIETKVKSDEANRPVFDNSALYLRTGDIAIVHFLMGPMNQDDPYFEYYTAHEYKEDAPCRGCNMGVKSKLRFTVGVWTHYILHAVQPMKNNAPDPDCPAINYQNRVMFQRTVNRAQYFDQTKWSGSCFDTIVLNWRSLGNMRVQMFQLTCIGEGLDKRIMPLAMPGSAALPNELYSKAVETLKPVKTRVMTMGSPVAVTAAPASLPVFTLPGVTPAAPSLGGADPVTGEIVFTPALPTPAETVSSVASPVAEASASNIAPAVLAGAVIPEGQAASTPLNRLFG